MNLLFIADVFPFPFDSGGKLRTANIITQLSKEYSIDLICLNNETITNENLKIAEEYIDSVEYGVVSKKSPVSRIVNLAKFKCDKAFLMYYSAIQRIMDKKLEEKDYSIIFVEQLYTYQYIDRYVNKHGLKTPVVVDFQNVEHELIYRMMKSSPSFMTKIYGFIEYRNIMRFEKKVIKQADHFLVVSERDGDLYRKIYAIPKTKISVVDNGVDLKIADREMADFREIETEKHSFLFIGSLWYRPNKEGVEWFINEVWNKILEKWPKSKLYIIGKMNRNDNLPIAANIEYLGFVDNIYQYYRKCSCFIVPLKFGSGTRLKIVEAFSFKIPIISTSAGAEGLDVTHRKELMIANTADEYSACVSALFSSDELVSRIVENGFNLVSQKYDWDIIGKRLNEKIRTIINDFNKQ